jgi:hypothetical protein
MDAFINYSNINFIKQDDFDINIAKSISGNFTIMIDDGPHSLSSPIKFLNLYLVKLDETGVLIIEEILFAYRNCYRLLRALPANGKYIFDVYNFEKI